MASKRSTPLENPPSASSSSEEEEYGSSEEEEELEKPSGEGQREEDEEEEEDEDEDEEDDSVAAWEPEKNTQKPLSSTGSKPTPGKSNESESESETESESESDSKPETPKAFAKTNVKPVSSKVIDPRPKGKAVVAVTVKRGAEGDAKDGKEAKRTKKEGEGEKSTEDVKKQPFQRLWSEEDEVAVLEGLIKKGVDAVKDIVSFHEFIGKDLHIDVSLAQLKDKVSRLKKKFDNNRKGKMGEEKTFSKSHDQKIFDLSKSIWGSEVAVSPIGDSPFKSNGKAKSKSKSKEKTKVVEKVNAAVAGGSNSNVENLGEKKITFDKSSGMEDYVMRKGAELLQGAKKSEMEEQLRQLHVEELELFLKRNELVREYTKVVLDAYKMDEDE